MKLYLLRHGHSPVLAEAGVASDFERPLSEAGTRSVRQAAERLLREGAHPSLILHSPLKRAAQTALEAAAILKPVQVEAFPPLSNAMPAEQLFAELKARLAGFQEALAIGHQPQLGELAAHLAGRIFELRTGGIIALELGEEGARPLWSCNPTDTPIL